MADERGSLEDFGPPAQPDPETTGAPETEDWIGFYRELLDLEVRTLAKMRELAAASSPAVRAEAARSNIQPMEQLIGQLRSRLAEWEDRREKLA